MRDQTKRKEYMRRWQQTKRQRPSDVPCEYCSKPLTLSQAHDGNVHCSVACRRSCHPPPLVVPRPCSRCGSERASSRGIYCGPCGREARLITQNKERAAQRNRYHVNKKQFSTQQWLHNHGLSLQLWNEYAPTRCDLCLAPLDMSGERRRFTIDHDHAHCLATGCIECVRGVLCLSCNTAEGHARVLVERGLAVIWGPIAAYWADPPFQRWRRRKVA